MSMQRFISALSLTVMLCGFTAVAQVQAPTGNSINRVVAAGWMTRSPSGDFRENDVVTRAELSRILVKAFQLDNRIPTQTVNPLQDVPQTHWAYNDILVVLRTGVMSGYREGRFFPDQPLTRAEAFSILAQAQGVSQFSDEAVNEILSDYPDAADIPNWARKPMATALYAGFVNVDEGGRLRPLEPMTRGDMAYALDTYLTRQQSPFGIP